MSEQPDDLIAGRDLSVSVNTDDFDKPWMPKQNTVAQNDLTLRWSTRHWNATVNKPVSTDCVIVYDWVDQATVQASCSCGSVASVKASQSEPAVDIERKIDVAMDHNTKQQESS